MAYAVVAFDLDGTIIDTLPDIVRAVNASLSTCGLKRRYSLTDGRSLVGGGVDVLTARSVAGLELTKTALRAYQKTFKENYRRMHCMNAAPFPGMIELLEEMKRRGVLSFVVTNKPQALAEEVVPHCYERSLFQEIIGSRPSVPLKPDPALLDLLVQKHQLKKSDILYVGDSIYDVSFAKAAGVAAALVTYGYGNYEPSLLKKADHVARDASELRAIILSS